MSIRQCSRAPLPHLRPHRRADHRLLPRTASTLPDPVNANPDPVAMAPDLLPWWRQPTVAQIRAAELGRAWEGGRVGPHLPVVISCARGQFVFLSTPSNFLLPLSTPHAATSSPANARYRSRSLVPLSLCVLTGFDEQQRYFCWIAADS
jgi:hypothetical protein